MKRHNLDKEIESFIKSNPQLIYFLGFLLVFTGISPFIFSAESNYGYFGKPSEVGDTIGGITAPFIGIIGAVVTFLAFWVQYKANQEQKRDLMVERFENKFYNIIDIHRQNVNETRIGKSLHGRKAFVKMYYELKYTYSEVALYCRANRGNFPGLKLDDNRVYNMSYLIFFFGIGPNSSKMVLDLLGNSYSIFYEGLARELKEKQDNWRNNGREKNDLITRLSDGEEFKIQIPYLPFNGHMSHLSHWIRNLFQLVKYVDDYPEEIITYKEKYNYISTLRAQLSTFEQLLLYYNAKSVLGEPWLYPTKNGENYLKKYCVVKSMPLPLCFYINPLIDLGEVNEEELPLFEWTEIQNRFNQKK